MTRVGLVARATATGLGSQSHNFYTGYKPDSVLVVRAPNRVDDLTMYPDAHVTRWDYTDFEPEPMKRFVDEVDVVFAAETLYSWGFDAALRAAEVRTVIQGNPEFVRPPDVKVFPLPDRWCWPTTWLVDQLPPGPILPVPMMAAPAHQPPGDERLTYVHVAGQRAIGDRNGTELFCKALRFLRYPAKVRIVAQVGELPLPDILPSHVDVETNVTGVADRWDLYRDADVLVSPRRFGGLSVPVLEAIGMGLVVMMTDCEPNRDWPIIPIEAAVGTGRPTPHGTVRTFECRPKVIAAEMDRLAEDRTILRRAQGEGAAWAREHTWERLRPAYDEVLCSTV